MPVFQSRYVAHKQATVSNAVKKLTDFGFSAQEIASADRVLISVTAGALRISFDPLTAPTTTLGLKLPTNNYPLFELDGRQNNGNLQMIRDAAADATVDISLIMD